MKLKWEELTEWHDVDGLFMERFAEAAVEGIQPRYPVVFSVIREDWRTVEDGLDERTILEAEFL